ncbi:hypothetical protein [Metasolibacillus fluoroglycofenilyticus]|uniref:hypothetical protein n=1 Tax=Metasolibacillus fluoroglycofenilyticus TaxID=1239396 RepID=UPI000D3A4BD9|nr:hypothetical protein [Metasolibacillus fluoroglycofenilyticus]
MKEIGGYFELEQFVRQEYYGDLIKLNTARNAIIYLIKARNIKKLYIPYYLCDSVRKALAKRKYEFEFYHVDENFKPIFNKELKQNEYLYIVNYYGQITNELIKGYKQRFSNIIFDNTHAFFQKPAQNIDTIYSCRKFFGVPDGAYLSTDVKVKEELEIDCSKDRMSHLLGRLEGQASEYYDQFIDVDKNFDELNLKKMSKLTENLLGAIDYEKVQKIRNENFNKLSKELSNLNKLRLIKPNGPFAYPFYIENGIEIRKELAKKKIYIPTLWPNVLKDIGENRIEYKYVANILPLPCDQRYNVENMKNLVKELKICIG